MMILEFMENGDLYQFLRRHEPEMAAYATSSNIQTLRLVASLYQSGLSKMLNVTISRF